MTRSVVPLFFISHGAPTFALEPGVLGKRLQAIGKSLMGVKAFLIISPHWQTVDFEVMTSERPDTLHDFHGFPEALYALRYAVAGAPEAAIKALGLLEGAGLKVRKNPDRGLDHGAWVPLMHLRPEGDIPVFQISMPRNLNPLSAFHLGEVLAPLRGEGISLVASGSMTHNLYDLKEGARGELPYVHAFADWVKQRIQEDSLDQLLAYEDNAPAAHRAHPTDEHFLPLFTALGARSKEDALELIEGGIEYGILSMDSFFWKLKER